jgi:hypothetical protein
MSNPRTSKGVTWTIRLVGLLSISLAVGCLGNPSFFRSQSPEQSFDDLESDSLTLVGSMTIPTGLNYTMVRGVGMVTGLKDTGGNPRPSPYKDRLLDEMATYDVAKPNGILAAKSTALVVVHGYLPPGIRKGERFDLFVSIPNRSDTTSLRHGRLFPSRLKTVAVLDAAIREGHVDGKGGGFVLVDSVFDNGDDEKRDLRGRVLGGGISMTDRGLGLRLRDAESSVVASTYISNAINLRFTHYVGNQRNGVAVPKTPAFIDLAIPAKYKHNVQRYMRVVRAIPVRLSPTERVLFMKDLEDELLEPTSTARAAIKLEALGKEAVPTLKRGLASNDIEVRFYSAEALAYLDDETAAATLAQIAAQERAFRWHALAALASIQHVSSYESLTQLIDHPSAETRYGAFRAMKARNPMDPTIAGEVLDDRLILHEMPEGGEPMVHFANTRSPEVVIFGKHPRLQTTSFVFVGRKMLIKPLADDQVRVIKYLMNGTEDELVTSNRLGDVVRAIVKLGGGYEEVYQACRSAKLTGKLDARIEVDSEARAGRRFDRDGENEGRFRAANPLPGLYREAPEGSEDRENELEDDFTPEPDSGFFGRIRSWASKDEAED